MDPFDAADVADTGVTDSLGVHRREVVLAGHTGDAARARLGLLDPAADVRVAALGALDRLAALTTEDVEAALADDAAPVRRRAAELGARVRDAEMGPAFADDDPLVVEAACWAAGEREDAGAVPTLTRLAREHEDAMVREAAVAALGAIGDEAGLPAILAATQDKPTVRRRAVLALAPFEGPEVDAALERARTDRDWQVRQAAEDLLS
jgi:HEAT repeat protein